MWTPSASPWNRQWKPFRLSNPASLHTALAAAEKRAEDAEKRAADAEKRAEDAQNRAEEMLKQVAAVTNSHGAIWQYFKDGSWETFPSEGNAQMHQAYLAYLKYASRSATITSGGVRRTVDFLLMQQEHVKTGNMRQVRLSLGVPERWVTAPGDLLLQGPRVRSFYVMVEDPELYRRVRRILRYTGHGQDGAVPGCGCMQSAKVKSIHRIENFHLWQRYKTKLTALQQDHAKYKVQVASVPLDVDNSRSEKTLSSYQDSFACREPLARDVDEKVLLHGTSWENANWIVRDGFDHRASSKSGLYGSGVYFAGAACKTHQYTCDWHKGSACDCPGERTLIIARVALGDSYRTHRILRGEGRPPNRDGNGAYDSVHVNPGIVLGHSHTYQTHQEFVIADLNQAYPAFVVQYQL